MEQFYIVGYTNRNYGTVYLKDTFGNCLHKTEKQARKDVKVLYKQNYAGHNTFIIPVQTVQQNHNSITN